MPQILTRVARGAQNLTILSLVGSLSALKVRFWSVHAAFLSDYCDTEHFLSVVMHAVFSTSPSQKSILGAPFFPYSSADRTLCLCYKLLCWRIKLMSKTQKFTTTRTSSNEKLYLVSYVWGEVEDLRRNDCHYTAYTANYLCLGSCR